MAPALARVRVFKRSPLVSCSIADSAAGDLESPLGICFSPTRCAEETGADIAFNNNLRGAYAPIFRPDR